MKMRAEDELEREQDHYCRACQAQIRAAPKLVHYGWPGACRGFAAGDLWTGNLDRVTCSPCREEEKARTKPARNEHNPATEH